MLALDGRHAETVHRHAVRLVGDQPVLVTLVAGAAGRGGLVQPLAAAHCAQHLLAEHVVPEHVHQRVERGRGQRARVHHLVGQPDDARHVHEQRRPAEQVRGQHHHGRLHGAALLAEQQRREYRVGIAPRQVRFRAHAVLPRPQAVPVYMSNRWSSKPLTDLSSTLPVSPEQGY